MRLKRVDLPPEVSSSVFTRMDAERKRVAAELRAKGAEEGERIRSQTDKERTLLLAQAERDAQRLRGEGDATAAARYTAAIGNDEDFYSFYRSLELYRESIGNHRDLLVLDPNSDLFRYFGSPRAGGR